MPIINEKRLNMGSYGVSSNGITVAGSTKAYNTIEQRNADPNPGMFAFVRDASSDPTVKSGFAIYYRKSTGWKKIFEEEAMDQDISEMVTIQWDNVVNRPGSNSGNLYNSSTIDRVVDLVTNNESLMEKVKIENSELHFQSYDEVLDRDEDHVVLSDRYVKWIQLVRPTTDQALHCRIKFYAKQNMTDTPMVIDSAISPSLFHYYESIVDENENETLIFKTLGSGQTIPVDAAGNFVIADVSGKVSSKELYIKYEWYQGNTIVFKNICVYPALTPTNAYSVGMQNLNWSNIQ